MTSDLNWNNFDQVSDLIESQAGSATDATKRRDANEALGQLLGITDKDVFRAMTIDQQNMFLQHIVDQSKSGGQGTDTTQKLLEGLQMRAPVNGIRQSYGLGMTPPTPGGMGGGAPAAPPQQYYQAPVQETPPWLLPANKDDAK